MLVEVSSVVVALGLVAGAVALALGWRRLRRVEETVKRVEIKVDDLRARKGPACMLEDITKKE